MTRTMTAREANQQFSKMLAHAERGEETVILKRGAPVAKLVPITDSDRQTEKQRRREALAELMVNIDAWSGTPESGWTFDRQDIYDDRFKHLDRR